MRTIALSLICTLACVLTAKETTAQTGLRFMFYNTENLFDTIDDPHTHDNDFLPSAPKKWNTAKYWSKLNKIAQVVLSLGTPEPPQLIALCEVETSKSLFHLTGNTSLNRFNYKFIHYDSPDHRGTDVALLYRPDAFRVITSRTLPVSFDGVHTAPTREILYVKGLLLNDDTIHIVVNHWPSRYGGRHKTDPKRLAAARTLTGLVDSVTLHSPNARILITGDFNDEPSDTSLRLLLSAKTKLVNLMDSMHQQHKGTLVHRERTGNQWFLFDQFICSQSLLQPSSSTFITTAFIHAYDFLLKKNKQGFLLPFRTYQGPAYKGGFSDHLPVAVDIQLFFP